MSHSRQSDNGKNPTVQYVLPLQSFEKSLVREAAHLVQGHQPQSLEEHQSSTIFAFRSWRWFLSVDRSFGNHFKGDDYKDEYHGDKNSAYQAHLHDLIHEDGHSQHQARIEVYQDHNRRFLERFTIQPGKDIEVIPAPEDESDWLCLAAIYNSFGRHWLPPRPVFGAPPGFEIWSMIRMFALHRLWPGNMDFIHHNFVGHPSFQELYNVEYKAASDAQWEKQALGQESVPRPSEQLKISKHQKQEQTEAEIFNYGLGHVDQVDLRGCILPSCDDSSSDGVEQTASDVSDEGNTMQGELPSVTIEGFKAFLQNNPPLIQDVRGYLQYIPWNELKIGDSKNIDPFVPFTDPIDLQNVILWMPPVHWHGSATNHLLHTEDEVFQYFIEHERALPDLYVGSSIAFVARPMKETSFAENIDRFWQDWNDCAITQRSSGELVLLETIPGLRFRARKRHQDELAALMFFRNIVEHLSEKSFNSTKTEILYYTASLEQKYHKSFAIITEDELQIHSWEEPLGRGQNGNVYAATWNVPTRYLKTSPKGQRKVVLKDVIQTGSAGNESTAFAKELSKTYKALGESPLGCVPFLGIAVIAHKGGNSLTTAVSSVPTSSREGLKSFLVFERATRGTAARHLEEIMTTRTYLKSWYTLNDTLSGIANGIFHLHRHEVLHRDLHMNNILVTDRYYEHDRASSHEVQLWISDLGESKILQQGANIRIDATAHRSYGATEFRAPEVSGQTGWTKAAEVFSFGVIACKLLDIRKSVCEQNPPPSLVQSLRAKYQEEVCLDDEDFAAYIVPAELKNALSPCLSHDPLERPNIRSIIRILDDFGIAFHSELAGDDGRRVLFTYWNWNETLSKGRSRMADEDGDMNHSKRAIAKFREDTDEGLW